jgi:hypothetical protein
MVSFIENYFWDCMLYLGEFESLLKGFVDGILSGILYIFLHFSTDRKFSEKFFNFEIFFRRKICVGQSLFTKFSFCVKFS